MTTQSINCNKDSSKDALSRSCPKCNSQRIWKDGLRKTKMESIQRFLCRDCGFRFSETSTKPQVKVNILRQPFKVLHSPPDLADKRISTVDFSFKESLDHFPFFSSKNVAPHNPSEITSTEKDLNALLLYNSNRQVCAEEVEAKNLAKVTSRQKQAAGATTIDRETIKGKVIEHLWQLKKNGYKESTIKLRSRLLRILMKRGANLLDPETVKETIASMDGCIEDTKAQYVIAYDTFAWMAGIAWHPPHYKQTHKLPFIPTETEVDQLIAACQTKTATLLQMLKETAMRIGEAWQLEWTDVDFERRVIRLNLPEKGSRARIFNISSKLIGMLKQLPKKSEKVFGYQNLQCKKANFRTTRKRVAAHLQNPRILQITFHTLRHWKATTLYHRTKDILYVKEFLGHKNINNTLKYIQLEKALFTSGADEFHVKVAKTLDEACKLLEVGFEYVTDVDSIKLFRKRK